MGNLLTIQSSQKTFDKENIYCLRINVIIALYYNQMSIDRLGVTEGID